MSTFDTDPFFTNLCSTKTVQSYSEGFFGEFYKSVEECYADQPEWLTNIFHKIDTDLGKLKCVYEDPAVSFAIFGTLEHVQPVFRPKDGAFSMQRREIAQKLMKAGRVDQALLAASQAVMRAPIVGQEPTVDGGYSLPFALWTRSEVLLKLMDAENALRDIQLTAKLLPHFKQNPEYFARLAKCHKILGEENKMNVSIKLYHQMKGLSDAAVDKLKEELQTLEVRRPEVKQLPQLTSGENADLPSASDHVMVEADERKGKYIVAKKDLKTADTVLVEKAVAACLYPKNYGSNCCACFKRLVAPIACNECSGVAFCSVECRDLACATFHKFECKYMDLLIGSGMSVLCHIALRIVTQTKSPQAALAAGRDLLKNLCTHSERREATDYLQRVLMTTFILRCLQKAEFFGRRKTESPEPTAEEYEVGALLLGLLQALQFNAHEIYETKQSESHVVAGSKVNYLGVGIFRTGALFNHDCYPGVTRYFMGTTMVLNTVRPIGKNEMVAENYGPTFTVQVLKERQRQLRCRYWFPCDCRACQENWNVSKKLDNRARLKCPNKTCTNVHNFPKNARQSLKCGKCKQQISLQDRLNSFDRVNDFYKAAAESMEAQNIDAAIEQFTSGINLFHEIAVPPHKDTHTAQSSLRACLASKGSTFK